MEILDAKYAKADLPAIVSDNCKHLNPSERESLLSLLLKFEHALSPLFNLETQHDGRSARNWMKRV